MKVRILLLFILLIQFSPSKAQENKENILRNFNYIEYYKDSTIKKAMNFKDFEPVGYCIEFDEFGAPLWIGQYKNWRKADVWLKSDGTIVNYTEKEIIVIPTKDKLIELCNKRKIFLLYSELTKNKSYCF